MKKIILVIIVSQLFMSFAFSQHITTYNTKSSTYLSEDTTRKVTSISYIDAFGRPKQNIVLGASPAGNDIVQTYQYDELGRSTKSYLPFTNNGGQTGEFVDDALDLQTSFYNTSFPDKNAYSEVEYDNSPYNRIIKQSMPGDDINSVNVSSEFTSAGGIDLWEVNNNNQLVQNGTYPSNSLLKFTLKDADDKETFIYKDKSGKVLLKKQVISGGDNIKTRYVYDKYGQLRYVLSPEAVSQMDETSYNSDDDPVKKYCYYYEYDNKHQLVTKQLPGKEPIYLQYDSKYRLRKTQDGNQRADNEDNWMFINYDGLGRTVSTGLGYIDPGPIPDTIIPPPAEGITAYLTYQYYDNYDFLEENSPLEFDDDLAYHEKFTRITGRSTGSKVRVMNDDAEWLTSVVYYDKYGRVIQTISQNNLGGYDIVSNEYNFAGELLESKHKHTAFNFDANYLVYLYTYDDMGRLLKTELSENADASGAIVINTITYNELGQVQVKKIHSEDGWDYLQTVNYGYNIKGAITYINDPEYLGNNLFAMKLYYDESIEGMYHPNTYKDGKISAIQWNSDNLNDVKTYMYTYDDLNRLTHASYHPGSKYSVDIDYDLNGNITHLERHGELLQQEKSSIGPPIIATTVDLIDDLTYTYNGNKLTSVSDAVGEIETQLNNDFRDMEDKGIQEYGYDANGNMIVDKNKGINLIAYNHLNQPVEIIKSADDRTEYLYTATGVKLQTKVIEETKLTTTTDYSGAYVYIDNKLRYLQIPGGRITYTRKKVYLEKKFEYHLTDHLGNVRVTFADDGNGNAEIIQEDHYYPFGMRMNGMHVDNTTLINKYLYNGKELQDQTNYLDYGFRQMDPQLGRWHVVDALAEKYYSHSPYAYTKNDPINHIDILGLCGTRFWNSNTDQWEGTRGVSTLGFAGTPGPISGSGGGGGGVGPSGKDYDDYKASGSKDSFHDWYRKHFIAAWKEGFTSRQGALAAGYSFSTVKYRKSAYLPTKGKIGKWIIDVLNFNDNDITIDITSPVMEAGRVNTAYYELERNPGSFLAWLASFDSPAGGLGLTWAAGHDRENKISRGSPSSVGIGKIMDVAGPIHSSSLTDMYRYGVRYNHHYKTIAMNWANWADNVVDAASRGFSIVDNTWGGIPYNSETDTIFMINGYFHGLTPDTVGIGSKKYNELRAAGF